MSVVLHVVVAGEVGGAERMLVDLAAASERTRHIVALVTPSERLRALFRDAGLDVEDRGPAREGPLTYLARALGPRDTAWLTGVARAARADVVHVHTFGAQVLGTRAALRAGVPLVRTEHSTRVYDDPSCWPFSRWSLARAAAAVAISAHVKRRTLERAPWAAPRMHVVPNGVDLARFETVPMPAPGGPRRLLALGRLDRRKGLDLALGALAAARARGVDVRLEIVGDGDERAALEARSATLGLRAHVTFSGFAEDVRPAIARAHALLSSARAEGLGIALLEGMAMGRAVVALPTGGVPEIVRDGETGWLAFGGSQEALARAIADAASDPEELAARGRRARAFVRGRYDLEAMRGGYAGIYEAVLSGRPRSGS